MKPRIADAATPALVSIALFLSAVFCPISAPATNPASGPTLHFQYKGDPLSDTPLADFMYFIALISPEPVMPTTSTNSTQSARLSAFTRNDHSRTFHATCDFEFSGDGSQCDFIDHSAKVRQEASRLRAGKPMLHQLQSINVEGPCKGRVEIEGALSNGLPSVTELRFRFNARSVTSPISIVLEDIHCAEGKPAITHEIIARVNSLIFRRKPGPPTMEVSIASIKDKNAGNGFWQNLKGSIKGEAANLFIPPLEIAPLGHDTMLEFGQALAIHSPLFTFPAATNLLTELPKLRLAGAEAEK